MVWKGIGLRSESLITQVTIYVVQFQLIARLDFGQNGDYLRSDGLGSASFRGAGERGSVLGC